MDRTHTLFGSSFTFILSLSLCLSLCPSLFLSLSLYVSLYICMCVLTLLKPIQKVESSRVESSGGSEGVEWWSMDK